MSQEAVAFDAEIERSRIGKMENGHLNPSLMTLSRICHSLDITLPQLFAGITTTIAADADAVERLAGRPVTSEAPNQKSAKARVARIA